MQSRLNISYIAYVIRVITKISFVIETVVQNRHIQRKIILSQSASCSVKYEHLIYLFLYIVRVKCVNFNARTLI